ncbi:MAG: T9SS type A sorting domain-containing protein [Fibrobacteres bacterium]|nr:T9SS type A sorting domain-containing protein [Fibrobacterota bacterium]
MKILILISVLLISNVFCSKFSETVATIKPRSFGPVSGSTGLEVGMMRVGVTNECVFPFANDAAWDPISESVLFIGAPHQHPWVWGFPIYKVETNSWRSGNLKPYFDPTGQINTHSYDNIASVYGSGKMYFYTPTPNTHPQKSTNSYCFSIYDIPKDTWNVEVIPNDMVSGPYSALNYFPDINSLIYTNAGKISRYRLDTKQWSLLGSRTMGGIHNVGEYDPVHKIMLLGGGIDSKQLYKMDTLLQITPIALAPKILDVSSMIFTCDPVTGTFIVWEKDSLYAYDVVSDKWSTLMKSPIANFQAAWASATPVKEYGVIAFMLNYQWPLLLYKHENMTSAEKNVGYTSLATASINASPSPANSFTIIKVGDSKNRQHEISIFDLSGKMVRRLNFMDNRFVWDLKDGSGQKVTPGVYLLKNNRASSKVVVY